MLRIVLVTSFQPGLDPLCVALRQLRWCLGERVRVVPSFSLPPPDAEEQASTPELPRGPGALEGTLAIVPLPGEDFGVGKAPAAPTFTLHELSRGGRSAHAGEAGPGAEGASPPGRLITGDTSYDLAWSILHPCLPSLARDFLDLVPRHANPELRLLGAPFLLELAEAPPFDLTAWQNRRTKRGRLLRRVEEILGRASAEHWTTSARLYTVLRRQEEKEGPRLLSALGFESLASVREGCRALTGLEDAPSAGWQAFLEALADEMGETGLPSAPAHLVEGDVEKEAGEDEAFVPWPDDSFARLRESFFSLTVLEARGLVGDQAIAESVANEVFAAVWEHGHRADRQFTKTYFRRAARNRALNRLNQLRIWHDRRSVEDPDRWPSRVPDPHSLVEGGERRKRLEHGLRRLDPMQGLIVFLVDACDWIHRDVAELLGISVDALRGRRRRGLAALRDQIPDDL